MEVELGKLWNFVPNPVLTLQVIKLISQVIADFANGEISQIGSLFDTSLTLQKYSDKSYYKTATLIAASCKSAAVFSGVPQEVKEQMFEYGRHLGLAFQVVDDILDFTQSAEQLGKPQVTCLAYMLLVLANLTLMYRHQCDNISISESNFGL